MQIERVATKVGTAICEAPSSTARTSGFRMAMFRCVFSISTVASSTRMPTASAKPPSVITLIVWPSRLRMDSEVRMESGIEIQTIKVLRQTSQKQQDHQAGKSRRNECFAHNALNGGAHENRLIGQRHHFQLRRDVRKNSRKSGFHGIHDGQRRGFAVARDGDKHAARAIRADDIVLHLKSHRGLAPHLSYRQWRRSPS